jgi:D-alanyl-D-alanine carboxypeptidase
MSIYRESRVVALGAAFLLLALLAVPASAIAAPQAADTGRALAAASAVAAPSVVPLQASGASGAAAGEAAPVAWAAGQAAPVALGTRAGAVPGALGAASSLAPGSSVDSGAAGGSATPAGGGGATATSPVAPPRLNAAAVLLADEQTGQVLFASNAEQERAMASTTKVMTALLALERLDQRRTVVIGTEPTTVGEESLELRKGERLTVHQLLLGLLVKSANDAAVALADAVDGTAAAFVQRMNRRAAQLGLRDTHYVTPYGLDRPGHHTSARDLARLWEVAMRRADFRALVSMRSGQLPGQPLSLRKFVNTNELLGSYPWVVGGKTGFTNDAGRCLVASASRGGRRLVAVALGSTNAFPDVRALFEYGFTAFDWVRLAQRGQPVTVAGPAGATGYQATADADALVRRDLLAKLTHAAPLRLVAAGAPPTTRAGVASASPGSAQSGVGGQGSATPGTARGRLTVWITAAGQRVAPLRLGPAGAPALPPLSRFAPRLVPAGSVAPAIDPFLRRAAA